MLHQFNCKPSGLYVLSKADIEDIAFTVLSEFQPEVLETPMPLDLNELAQKGFSLECREAILSQKGSILGYIAFQEENIPIYDESMHENKIHAKKGTIIIEKRLNYKPTRYRFTVAHELAHWILHRNFYSPINIPINRRHLGCSYIACRQEAEGRKNPVEARTDLEWSEWQSDCMAAALLMPQSTFVPAAKQILRANGFQNEKLIRKVTDSNTHNVITELAQLYNVSKRSVQIRLGTFGFYSG